MKLFFVLGGIWGVGFVLRHCVAIMKLLVQFVQSIGNKRKVLRSNPSV